MNVLIGTGSMASDYSNVLQKLNVSYKVIGRGADSAELFENSTGIKPFIGGLDNFLAQNHGAKIASAIIAVGTESLMSCLLTLLKFGVKKILIEKPAALSIKELLNNEEKIKPYQDSIYVAYNRRFYSSALEAQRLIEEDGGLKSMHFEFTEWAHKIEELIKSPDIRKNIFFSNSTHVIDLAFYLAGKPKEWQSYSKSGNLNWHEKTNFSGAGITDEGVIFSYISNWESAGRWGIELLTDKRRIYLKPMEKISTQLKGSVALVEHAFDDSLDIQFKPGLMLQVEAFLTSQDDKLINIKNHILNAKNVYSKIIS
jgi:predicted dehydrogenase